MNNKPTHTAYYVKDLEEKDGMPARGVWREIGAAWPNKDGDGYTIILEAFPASGKVIIRKRKEKPAEENQEQAA